MVQNKNSDGRQNSYQNHFCYKKPTCPEKVFLKCVFFFSFQEPSHFQPYIALKCIHVCLVCSSVWGGACLWFLGNRKCLKQSFHYKINKDRELLQYIKIFVFYLPYMYIPKKNQQNTSHAIATKTAKHFYWEHPIFHFLHFVSKILSAREQVSGWNILPAMLRCFWNEGTRMLPDMCHVQWKHFTEIPKCILWELRFSMH